MHLLNILNQQATADQKKKALEFFKPTVTSSAVSDF